MVYSLVSCQEKRENKKQKELARLKEVLVPIRFKIIERKNGIIKTEFRFYSMVLDDIEGKDLEELAKEQSLLHSDIIALGGEELFIDCLKFQEDTGIFAHDVYWVFPYRIFTDYVAPDKGVPLYPYYDDGFPKIYGGFDLGDDKRQRLTLFFSDIKKYGDIAPDNTLRKQITGNAVHDMNTVARFQVDRWYDLVIHIQTGAIEFVAE
ncbi:MAG: hypothetical protein LBT14_05735 [Treponema sp.]|nr:hypothetical protein [Treponema sp.]